VPQVNQQLDVIGNSLPLFLPEIILAAAVLFIIVAGLFKPDARVLMLVALAALIASISFVVRSDFSRSIPVFEESLRVDGLGSYLKVLMAAAGILTLAMTPARSQRHPSEYLALILAIVFGGYLLVMSHNFLMIFLSLEVISICSYVLAGFSFSKRGAEGSFKYFIFGSVASATMVYGFSLLYGITGSLNFSSPQFFDGLLNQDTPITAVASFMILAGFLYKVAAAPMHPWAPDVYEAAPIPVIAFLSVAPKAAGFGILTKFVLAINLHGLAKHDWQTVIAVLALVSITIGNFSALRQNNPKRMMAYSSIAQSGFLLIGLAAFLPQGIHFMLFYLAVYLLMNFIVFNYLEYFSRNGVNLISEYQGVGKFHMIPMLFLLIGLVALTGLPPTAGFTAKLLIFSSLWEGFSLSGDPILFVLLMFGLFNTVVALFYYLRIPYFAYLKTRETPETQNIVAFENLFGAVLVVLVLLLFFMPNLLMGWINKINFVV
jgi:NADH-quinone oxidoreductase subunit N